jgi:hypothetical protein
MKLKKEIQLGQNDRNRDQEKFSNCDHRQQFPSETKVDEATQLMMREVMFTV